MYILIYPVLMSFFITILLGKILIPVLHRLKFGQSEREEGPKSHKKKAGTPTMGGIMFILASIITMLVIVKSPTNEAMIALYAFVGFGIIGALDDGLKIYKKNNLGLRAYQKMIMLIVLAVPFAYYCMENPNIGTSIIIPFANRSIDLGMMYIPFIVFFFAAVTNAVNLTDGLDGLVSSVTLPVVTFFAIVSFAMGHGTLSIFCAVIAGSLLGFLRYNVFPAQVFMGDTGSLALGGAIAFIAMVLKLELLVIIVGGIYVLETLSVIIQVASFKLTGRRVFKMSPIHHHFELSGWHETKVVSMFCIITVILCLLGFLSL
jgi:phospho-N-acetylmuramoyl-pentapeptide-transferase